MEPLTVLKNMNEIISAEKDLRQKLQRSAEVCAECATEIKDTETKIVELERALAAERERLKAAQARQVVAIHNQQVYALACAAVQVKPTGQSKPHVPPVPNITTERVEAESKGKPVLVEDSAEGFYSVKRELKKGPHHGSKEWSVTFVNQFNTDCVTAYRKGAVWFSTTRIRKKTVYIVDLNAYCEASSFHRLAAYHCCLVYARFSRRVIVNIVQTPAGRGHTVYLHISPEHLVQESVGTSLSIKLVDELNSFSHTELWPKEEGPTSMEDVRRLFEAVKDRITNRSMPNPEVEESVVA